MIEKIISGGQTGVDTAALDSAIHYDVPIGGWCPMGRINETGFINAMYDSLKELLGNFSSDQEKYNARTQRNIEDSDGTLIIVPEDPLPVIIKDGTRLTIQHANLKDKPYICLSLTDTFEMNAQKLNEWIDTNDIKILNIAGPRESSSKGIYDLSYQLLEKLLVEHVAKPIFTI
jgi:hypothetical protein